MPDVLDFRRITEILDAIAKKYFDKFTIQYALVNGGIDIQSHYTVGVATVPAILFANTPLTKHVSELDKFAAIYIDKCNEFSKLCDNGTLIKVKKTKFSIFNGTFDSFEFRLESLFHYRYGEDIKYGINRYIQKCDLDLFQGDAVDIVLLQLDTMFSEFSRFITNLKEFKFRYNVFRV